jgi:hypothetical protein
VKALPTVMTDDGAVMSPRIAERARDQVHKFNDRSMDQGSWHSGRRAAETYPQRRRERPEGRSRFPGQSSVRGTIFEERDMRSFKLVLTVTGFVTYFVGMIGMSALTTSVVHSALSPRAVPMTVIGG